MSLDPVAIRKYVGRDWSGARERKRAYWRTRLANSACGEALAVTEQLRQWMMSLDGDWPTQAQRDEDLRTHAQVAAALAKTPRVARADRGRARRVR
jgi:hypothetical protein